MGPDFSTVAPEQWAAEEQLLRVAWYYYVDGVSQDDIAKLMGVSSASAGRLLERCRQSGIVSFTINSEYYSAFEVGRRLKERFSLREALVPPMLDSDVADQSTINQWLGRGGAQYLQNHLKPGDLLGMGWGDTVRSTVDALNSDAMSQVSTVSLTGGVGTYVNTLRRVRTGHSDSAHDSLIPAPILASSAELARALRAEEQVQLLLERARHCDHAVIGVGAVGAQATLVQVGYTSAEQLAEFAEAGAVGDLLGVFYDRNGKVLDLPLHDLRIGISMDDLRRVPNVVAIAGGMSKYQAVLGALRGGYLDVLVTTEDVARALLEEPE
jgi:lsr operon transcriptional repressor